MSRCVCNHIKALHFDGVCRAVINPCGCRQFEDEEQAQRPSNHVSIENYEGRYNRRYSA